MQIPSLLRGILFLQTSHNSLTRRLLGLVFHLGGFGLLLLGLLDNSLLPITGSMDIATVLLCAQRRQLWGYYAAMATVGAVAGGYITYRLARKGGKRSLKSVLSPERMKQVHSAFEKWGFGAIVIPAVLPPPFPMVPFLIAAGATQYSRSKVFFALLIGRAVRYTILGILGHLYGGWIISVMRAHWVAAVWVGVALMGLSIAGAVIRVKAEKAATSAAA